VQVGVSAAGRRLFEHPRIGELYPEYLITSHGIVRASVPLMETALRALGSAGRDDALAAHLAGYLDEHIPEERDHDEWILQDLEVLGVDRAAVLRRQPSASVAAMVGSQYYWILHHHPVALLGYICLLEAYPPVAAEVERLVERTGFDRAAFRTLLHHAELDPGHAQEVFATIDALPLSPEQAAALGVSAITSAHYLSLAVQEVVAGAR
jgi:pyrroloquinoline quinone (PQQ) biosynthesis protein C